MYGGACLNAMIGCGREVVCRTQRVGEGELNILEMRWGGGMLVRGGCLMWFDVKYAFKFKVSELQNCEYGIPPSLEGSTMNPYPTHILTFSASMPTQHTTCKLLQSIIPISNNHAIYNPHPRPLPNAQPHPNNPTHHHHPQHRHRQRRPRLHRHLQRHQGLGLECLLHPSLNLRPPKMGSLPPACAPKRLVQ